MDVGPVELIIIEFPTPRAGPEVVERLQELVASGIVTILDLTFLSRSDDGEILVVDIDEGLDEYGFAELEINSAELISDDDMDIVRDFLEPGHSAAVIVYEQSWAREFASAARAAGGEVALHLQIPHETVVAALEAATTDA